MIEREWLTERGSGFEKTMFYVVMEVRMKHYLGGDKRERTEVGSSTRESASTTKYAEDDLHHTIKYMFRLDGSLHCPYHCKELLSLQETIHFLLRFIPPSLASPYISLEPDFPQRSV